MVFEQTCSCGKEWDKKHVPNIWRVWSQTFIKHVNTGNTVVWRTQHNNADWDCSKTRILQETSKTRSQHHEVFCAFSEAEHPFQSAGCVRNRLQFHTVLQKLKSFLWVQVCAWTVFPPSLSGIWWLKYFTPYRTEQIGPRDSHGETVVKPNMHNPIPIKPTNVIPTNIDNIPSNTKNSDSCATLYVFEDNEAVIKMMIKGRSPTMRHVSWSHRVALDWLFYRINLDTKKIKYVTLTPNINSQTFWPKVISHVTNGTIFFSCVTSAISAPIAALRISAW